MTQIAKVRTDNTSTATYTGTVNITVTPVPVGKVSDVPDGGRSLVIEINDKVNAKGSIG